jgi:hypothetical protein
VSDHSSNEGIETKSQSGETADNSDDHCAMVSLAEPSMPQKNTISYETDSLTGDVYELTHDEAGQIVQSGQVMGTIWLTDTYGANTTSFVTIRISNELTDQLIIGRPRIM